MSRSFKYHPFTAGWDDDHCCKRRLSKSYRRKTKVMLSHDEMFIDPTRRSLSESMWSSRGYYIHGYRDDYDLCMRK
jgi:hypothetical protein